MKRLLKKGLSLLLAVLMVVSMLPTSAWAVTFADGEDSGREETPIVDEGGDISSGVHTSGGTGTVRDRYDNPLTEEEAEETEEPVDPDPSDVPADPLWTNGTVRAIINPDGTWRVTLSSDATQTDPSMAWGVALVPNVTRGTGMSAPADHIPTLDGGLISTWTGLRDNIIDNTGLTLSDFAIMGGGANASLYPDSSGNFVVESNPSTKLPELSYLQSEFGLGSTVDVMVVFFTKGSGAEAPDGGVGTHVKYTTATYGSEAKGVPSTTYILNKTSNTLTFVSGSIGTTSWNPKDAAGNPIANNTVVSGGSSTLSGHGSWNSTGRALSVPVYNTYSTEDYPLGVQAVIDSPSLPSGVTNGTLNRQIPSGATADVSMGVGATATSGTIVLPVTVTDPDGGGQITTATITILIMTGTVMPVTFDIDYGETTPPSPVTITMASETGGYISDWDTSGADGAVGEAPTVNGEEMGIGYQLGAAIVVEDMDFNVVAAGTSYEGTNASITLDPVSSGTYRSELTIGTHDSLSVDFPCLDDALEAATLNVPIIITVHGGKATFIDKSGKTVATVQGKPNGLVSTDTDGTTALPDLNETGGLTKWGYSSAGPALPAAQVVLGARDGNVTYYEVEETVTYTVKYSANGKTLTGSVSLPGDESGLADGTSTTGANVTLSATGYTFKGWNTAADGSGTAVAEGNQYTVAAAEADGSNVITLYAQWTPTYKVEYKNSATTGHPSLTVPTDSSSPYEAGSTVTILGVSGLAVGDERDGTESPTPKVYKFLGWDMGGTKYYSSGTGMTTSFTINADSTLTAAWEEVKYTVKFDTNVDSKDITVSGAHADVTNLSAGAAVTLPTISDSKGHYSFLGWAKTNNASSALSSYNVDKNDATNHVITLYAVWSALKYDVEYANAAAATYPQISPLPATVQYMKDDPVTVDTTAVADAKNATTGLWYSFVAWTTSDATIASGGFTMPGKKVTLTASWTPVMLNVTYDLQGGTEHATKPTTGATSSVQKGGTYTIGAGDPTKAGYTFKGWTATGGGSGTGLKETNTVTNVSADLTLTAVWEAKQNTVRFLYNYDSAPTSGVFNSQNIATGGSPTDPGTPTRTGYTFEGWYTDAGCTAANKVTNVTAEVISADKDYYANWTHDPAKVTFHTQSGTWASDFGGTGVQGTTNNYVVDGHYHDTLTVPTSSNISRFGYTFKGWATSSSSTTTVTVKTKLGEAAADSADYYAVWEAITYKVTYTDPANSGATMPGQGTITAGAVTLSAPTSVPSGWHFVNWKVSGGTTTYGGTQSLTGLTGDLALEAQWTVNVTYTSTYGTAPTSLTNVPYNSDITIGAIAAKTGDTFSGGIYTDSTTTPAGTYKFTGWTASPAGNIDSTTVGATDATVTGPVTLTAGWVGQSSVKFDTNGGTITAGKYPATTQTGDVSTTPGSLPTATAADATRTGYTFQGWALNNASGTTAVTVANIKYPATAGATDTYYAIWKINEYTVTYVNGGHGTVASAYAPMSAKVNYMADYTPVVAAHVAIPAGSGQAWESSNTIFNDGTQKWLFKGWTASGGTASGTYQAGDTVEDLTGNLTLTANWEEVFVVSFNSDGGSNSPASQQGVTGTSITLPDPGTKANAEFDGWYDGTTKVGGKGDSYTITKTVELKAVWKGTSMVKFDLDGGAAASGKVLPSPNPLTGETGTAVTLPADMVKTAPDDANKADHTFRGWSKNTKSTSASDAVADITAITFPANAGDTDTYYAIWVPDVTVTFDANTGAWGSGSSATSTQSSAGEPGVEKFTVPANPAKDGYAFKGWFDAATGGTAVSGIDATTTHNYPASAKTYYAQWDKLYTVIYDINAPTAVAADFTAGVTADSTTTTTNKVPGKKLSETVTVPKMEDTTGNYVFKGWKSVTNTTTQGNNDYTVADGDAATTVDATEHQFVITLTAQWVKKVKVEFQANGGTFAAGATTTFYQEPGTTYTAPADPTRNGYDFASWSASTTGTTVGTIPTADTVYTAQWTAKKYDYTFNGNGGGWGTGGTAPLTQTKKYETDEVVAKWTPDPTRTGYTFKGWASTNTATTPNVTFDATGPKMPPNDTEVYAVWEANKYHINYHVNSGGGSSATIAAADASVEFTFAEIPEKKAAAGTIITGTDTGWTFTGWSTSTGVQTVAYAAGADLPTATTAGDINLYAQWTVDVTFHGNAPSGTTVTDPGTKTTTPGGTLAAADYNAPATLTDYTFAGWFDTNAATGGTQYTAISTYPAPKDLYARWTPVDYTYTFDPNGGAFPNGTADTSTTGGIGTAIPGPNDGAATPATVNPVWKDHTFKGWNATKANADAGTADASLPDATMPSGGKTIYAAWTENTYKYNFDANKGTWGGTPEVTVQTKTGKAGTTVTVPDPAPTYTDVNGRHYRFDGWFTAATGGTKVADNAHVITGNSTDGAVTNTVYAHWTPLYIITYNAGTLATSHSATITQPTGATTTPGVPDGKYNTAAPYDTTAAGALISATGGSWDGTTRFNTADGKHWKFEGWTPDGGTTVIIAGNQVTINGADVTLTAVWTQEYKITLKGGVRADETTSAGAASATLKTSTVYSNPVSPLVPYIYVSSGFATANAALVNNNSDYVFVKWMATNTGAFTNGTAADTTQSTNASDTFTPTADTEITPVFAKKPGLTPQVDGYQLNFATGTDMTAQAQPKRTLWQYDGNSAAGQMATHFEKDANSLPTYTWDKGDATLVNVTIQKVGDTAVDTLTAGTEYTYNAATGKIEFQRAYLLGLAATQDYTVTVNYTLNGTAGTNTAKLWAVVTPDQLTEVKVTPKDGTSAKYEAPTVTPVAGSASASVTVPARNQVKYLDHKATTIVPGNLLTYQWYYAPGPSTPNYHTAVGNLTLPTGAVAIGTSTTDNFVDMDNDTYKGKYIFATVVATGTGYGAVVTNSIPVDYDAVIKVNKDGAADTTDGAYTVYLVPQPATGSNAATYTAANLPASKVATTHTASTNQYATDTSALTGGVTYDVYVNRLEGDASIFVKTDKTVSTQTAAAAAPVLDFYSVNAVDTNLLHKQDANNEYVGESFGAANADAPVTEFYAEGIATKFDSGKGVFTGTKVTAKASKTWTQDYDVNWGMKEDTGNTAPTLPYGTDNQAATGANNAVDTGKDYSNIDAKTWIGAQLEQNVYNVTGNVWVNGYSSAVANAGIVPSSTGAPTLTFKNDVTGKTYKFSGTANNNGVHKSTVTFTGVPKSSMAAGGAITGKYVVTATAKASNVKSTIKKYVVGGTLPNTGNVSNDDNTVNARTELTNRTLAADVNATNAAGSMFTVVTEASTYILKAADTETSPQIAQHAYDASTTKPGAPNAAPRLAVQPWTGTYAGITAKTYTINVTNEGNMPLDVTLNILRTLGGTNAYVYGPQVAATGSTEALTAPSGGVTVWTDGDNGVTFGDLKETFSLAAKGDAAGKDKVTFTVTVPADLEVNTAADYAFELTSKEGALYGPSVTYKLTQKVTPLEVTGISTSHDTGTDTYTPANLEIGGSTTIPTGVKVNTATDPDVVYEWYAVPHGSTVALNNAGKLTVGGAVQTPIVADGSVGVAVGGGSYKPNDAHAGMDVYLVARGQGVSGNVLEAALTDPPHIVVKYDLDIQVNENTAPTQKKGNYKVYLWDKAAADAAGVTTFDPTNTTYCIEATATATTTDGLYHAAGLTPGVTYDIYTNAVGGTASNWRNSGETADYSDYGAADKPTVVYHDVTLNNTATDNSPYSFSASDTTFLNDTDASTPISVSGLEKPGATYGAAKTAVATTADNQWVQEGATIDLTYKDWNRDYKLEWTGTAGSDTVNGDPTADATTTATVSGSTTIGTELTLNLYDVEVYAFGSGTVTYVTLTGNGKTFTTQATSASAFNGIGGARNSIPADDKTGNLVTFKLPAGTYEAGSDVATGTTFKGYRNPHTTDAVPDGAPTTLTGLVVNGTSAIKFDVLVNATGQFMTVSDNAKSVDNTATDGLGVASFTSAVGNDTVDQVITLPYGYDAKTLTVTVANTSSGTGETIYDVNMTQTGFPIDTLITLTGPTGIALDGSADMTYDKTGGVGQSTAVTVTIGAGLDVGDHTGKMVFSFNHVGDDAAQGTPQVTYNLKVTVEPTKFTKVTVADEDGTAMANQTVALGKDLKFDTYTTSTVDDWNNGKHLAATDYTYQWYHGPANKTATESWDNSGTAAVVTVTDATAISGATSATLDASVIDDYPGERIYLVISAVKGKNVIEAAISDPITTGFQPVVKVAVDGVDQSTVTGFDGTGYTATIDDGATTWNTAWDDTAGGFVPVNNLTDKVKVSLDATKEYTAKVSRVQGDGTNLVALPDKLKNTTTDDTVTAEYFTVNTVETKAFEGITGLGEDFGGADKLTGPAVSLTLADNTALTTGTPVLKNQSVVAKTADWTQDYELTWYTRMDGAATVPTRDTAYEGATPAMTAQGGKVDHTSASGTGYTVNQVTNKLYVGGRLDQIKYTIVGTVAGTGTVGKVALEQTVPKGANYIYPDTTTPATSPVKPTSTASVTDGPLAKDETVTFTVVKGTFTITPTEGANTVIKKVSWEGTDVTPTGTTVIKDKPVQLKADPTNRRYDFVVTVEGADIKLKVSDDVAAPNTTSAESNPNAWNDDTNGVERYFNYLHFKKTDSAAADTYEYELTLTNAGNKAVKVNAEVYHFDTAPATGFGTDATKWAATKATGTKVYETADGATANLTGASGKTVLSLSDMLSANTVVDAKSATTGTDGSADAGKITLGTDAWSKDSGAYVFHFMGETNDADKVAVDVYYVLDLTIDQLPIVGVATNNDGTSMPGVGDTITVQGYNATAANDKSLENVTVQTSTQTSQTANAAAANLTGDDVHFAWVKVKAGEGLAKANLSVTHDGAHDGELATTKGSVVSQGRTYTLVDGDQDSDFYLVAFAPNYTGNVTNATDLAIASVIKAKRTAGVKVSLNNLPVNGATDPGYKVYLVESGKTFDADHTDGSTGTWATAWNAATNRYEAAIDLENKTYEIHALTYQGGATVLKAIEGTLGKQTPTGTKNEETVPYWNVTFTENVAVDNTNDGFKSYLPGKGTTGAADTDNAIQKALSVKVSTTKGGSTYEANALTASTTSTATTVPVLEGMNVQVTVDATKSSKNTADGVKKSWSETDVQPLHTLTATGWTNSADNKGSGIDYADSIVSNAVPVGTSAKTFSAKLDQVRFDVTFNVKDISEDEHGAASPSSKTKVRQVTLIPDGGKGETGSYSPVSAVGSYGHGDTVTISGVPAGSFEVKATAVPGTPTLVKGYTWNATGDALDTPITPGKIVTVVGGADADDTNKHAGNTIQTIEATKVVSWSDTFDEATGGVLADGAFNPSNGFVKADNTTASPKKLFGLTEGYTAAGGAVLEYTVRVTNGGTDDMTGFYLTRTTDSDLTYDLTDVTWHKADGTEVKNHDATTKFTLGPGDYLEFTMTIPEGQAAQADHYTTTITPNCDLNAGETLGGGTYAPEYQVKSPVKFKPGKALVLYGGSAFESNTDIDLDWPATTDEPEPTFTYEVLELDGTNDADILALINEKLELTGANALTTLDDMPTWLTGDTGTGAITIPTGAYANTVNVKVKGTPANFAAYDDDANGHKVNNEVTLYIKATDTKTDEVYVIPYVVDVEPGQLVIQGPVFDPKNPEDSTKRPYGGTDVDKADFQYTKVVNQAAAPLDVIPAGANTGAGNDPSQETPTNGKVFVNDGTNNVHTATWTVDPTKYVSEVATDYAFTVTYKPENGAEKWNYKPATWAQEITAEAPPQYTVTYDWNTHTPDGKTLPGPYIVDPKVNPNHKVSDVLTVGTDYKDVSGTDGLYWNFKGWNTAADGSGTAYAPNATFQPTANVTLYAQWEAKMLNVTYKYNGNGTPDKTIPNAVQKGGSYTVAEADPTWSGRTFLGWSVTGGTPSANPLKTGGAVNAVTTNVVLTARWERDKSTIVYDWNYTGSAKATHTGNTGERDTAVPTTAPAYTGYTWDGKWYAEPTCETQITAFNFPATKGATVTYYAKWTRDTSKIAFALDGGTLEGYPQTYEGNTSEALAAANFPAAAPTKAGYTFTGWRGDDGKTYTASALPNFPATKDALLTITAQWTRDQSTVTFLLDGGNINGETDDIVRRGNTGERMIATQFPVPDPVRKGYAFTGWLGEDGNPYDINNRPSYPANRGGNLNVTAQWRQLVQGLKFSDERSNDAAVNDAAGKITMVNPDAVLTAPDLQKAFPPAQKVERAGEYVVYLDTEPRYTVALHSVGDPVYDMSVTATDARGVKYTDLPVNVASFASTDDVKVITLDLEALSGRLWAGEHHILLTATGNTEADGTGETVTATYELTFEIKKRPIPVVDLIPDPTDPTDPDKTKVTGEDGEDLRKPDSKGNTPVDKPTITKTPTDPKPGETYEIKTTLEPDPNYVFEPKNDPTDPTETPNYTKDGKGDKDWPEGDPDLSVTVKPEDPGADVTYVVTMRQPLVTIGAHLVTANSDSMVMSAFTSLIGQELRAYRAQSDDTEKYPRTGTTYGTDWWWSMGDAPAAVLDIQPGTDKDGKEVKAPVFDFNKTYVLTVRLDPDEVNYRFVDFQSMTATFDQFNANLKRDLTRQANAAALKANTEGFTILTDDNGNYYLRTYYRANRPTGGGGGGGGSVTCPSQVTYLLGLYGTTKDPVMEMVSGTKATKVPNVTAITGYKFLGWSLAGPIGDAEKDAERTLVDPKEVPIEGDTTFYAVYQPLYTHGRPFHEHYVIGYPNGNFGPSDNINRASVATIIARAVLPNFVEGADYGNPGGYSDVSGHWAASAIAYCTRYGVFKGYEDGTFRPDQPISRQELVLTLARLSGMQTGTAPFSDLNEAGDWAKGGIYTAYVKGWVNGYTDGTFRPTNPIARDETVKIFNAYLYRGVNAEGLSKLSEYVHSGVASNNTENGTSEYMTWPDVPKDQWAYYEIIEAANDHEYTPDETKKAGYTVPEVWTKCWIDEKWRYHDDANDGGPAAVTMALLRKYGVIA